MVAPVTVGRPAEVDLGPDDLVVAVEGAEIPGDSHRAFAAGERGQGLLRAPRAAHARQRATGGRAPPAARQSDGSRPLLDCGDLELDEQLG